MIKRLFLFIVASAFLLDSYQVFAEPQKGIPIPQQQNETFKEAKPQKPRPRPKPAPLTPDQKTRIKAILEKADADILVIMRDGAQKARSISAGSRDPKAKEEAQAEIHNAATKAMEVRQKAKDQVGKLIKEFKKANKKAKNK